jgi:hypothetical protein
MSRSAFISVFALGMSPAPSFAGDLSRYRDFQLGTDLATIASQVGASPSQAKVIHRRPALIQEVRWRPQALGSSPQTEAAEELVFSFYAGELFRIVVNYDRYETEGLTANDVVDAISATYGMAAKPFALGQAAQPPYGDHVEVLARWQDPQYRLELTRSSYGPSFNLTVVLKKLEAAARADILEAKRLDDQEAPQREAARVASEEQEATAKLAKARLVNKLKFRP